MDQLATQSPRIVPLPPDPALNEQFEASKKSLGFVPNSLLIMQRKPKMVKALAQMLAAVWDPDSKVDRGFKRLVAHVASRAAGCQYCMAHTAGGAEIITPECGIVLDDPDDPKALAQAVGHLASNDEARLAMGRAANELATGFGWARMAQQYIALYRQIAGRREDRRRANTLNDNHGDPDALAANVLAGPQGADRA